MARERKHKQHTWGSVCVWFMSVDLGEGLPPWPEVFLSLLERGPRDFLRATLRTGLSGVFGWLTQFLLVLSPHPWTPDLESDLRFFILHLLLTLKYVPTKLPALLSRSSLVLDGFCTNQNCMFAFFFSILYLQKPVALNFLSLFIWFCISVIFSGMFTPKQYQRHESLSSVSNL